jgi:hypothetical protein
MADWYYPVIRIRLWKDLTQDKFFSAVVTLGILCDLGVLRV